MRGTEKTLVAMGEDQRLRDIRMLYQHATEPHFREVIERLTGRRVIGFVSGMDTGRDISAEVFYLEPLPTADRLLAARRGWFSSRRPDPGAGTSPSTPRHATRAAPGPRTPSSPIEKGVSAWPESSRGVSSG
jgi:hypothetical protein